MSTFSLKRGNTWSHFFPVRDLPVKDPVSGEIKSLVDAVGPPIVYAVVTADVRLDSDQTRSLALTKLNGLTVTEEGVRMTLSAAQSETLAVARHAFDLQIVWADGVSQSTDTHYLDVVQDQTHA